MANLSIEVKVYSEVGQAYIEKHEDKTTTIRFQIPSKKGDVSSDDRYNYLTLTNEDGFFLKLEEALSIISSL